MVCIPGTLLSWQNYIAYCAPYMNIQTSNLVILHLRVSFRGGGGGGGAFAPPWKLAAPLERPTIHILNYI